LPVDKLNKRFDENFLQSPVPFLIASKNFILGKKSPTIVFRLSFYCSSAIFLIYFLWHLISFFSILFRHEIFDKNKIDVDTIILKQAKILGFSSADFIKNLELFHCFSMLCWGGVFVSAVFLWRRLRGYFLFYCLSFLSYIILMWVLLGMDYITNEITSYDYFFFLILFISLLIPFIYDYLKRTRRKRMEEKMEEEAI